MDIRSIGQYRYFDYPDYLRLMVFVRNNMRVLLILLSLVILGMLTMSFISLRYEALQLSPVVWLFIQSLCLYLAYLCFQTIFFDRFIACFRIRGNVGFFIVLLISSVI